MLDLRDFVHLPQVETLFAEIAQSDAGLIVVAGLEPRGLGPSQAQGLVQPSGRATILNILLRQLLSARPGARAVVVAEDRDAVRISKRQQPLVEFAFAKPPQTLPDLIRDAMRRRVQLLVVDRLTSETAPLALEAAQSGMCVLAQLDTVLRGVQVVNHLRELGAMHAPRRGLAWVVAVQRLPTLCDRCKEPEPVEPARLAEIRLRYPHVQPDGVFFREGRCAECNHTGRRGNIAVFDVLNASANQHVLPLEEYVLSLAAQGLLSLDDVIHLDSNQLYRTYKLLTASEEALTRTNAALGEKTAELEVAGRVLEKQTEASITLQEVGHALITLNDLHQVASYVCGKASDLCGADRVVLYLFHPDDTAEILAVQGWDRNFLHRRLEAREVLGSGPGGEAMPFTGFPPGIPERVPDLEGAKLRAGLRVPLIAQQEVVGLLIFHSTVKRRFLAREVALLQAFADQSAVAIQRAGLIEALQEKIERLEAAQLEIAKKERLERELELARQVQQSMLPKIFPMVPGFEFHACCEPARQVGGDFYDIFLLDGHQFGLVVADVSDKGMPAALFMALTRSLLLAEARRERSPSVVLNRVHRLLSELSHATLFVTLFYGVVDGATRTMTYVRAGHERPLLVRRGTANLLEGEGTVLGLLDPSELRLQEVEVQLEPGDRLVLYTDGLADAMAPNGEPFGRARLINLLKSRAETPLHAICSEIFNEIRAHQGAAEQYDDMTLLAVGVN